MAFGEEEGDNSAMQELPQLETECPKCSGIGTVEEPYDESDQSHVRDVPCQECNGQGWIPTESGRQILKLIQHQLETQTCDACDGRGVMGGSQQGEGCNTCGGLGVITTTFARWVLRKLPKRRR